MSCPLFLRFVFDQINKCIESAQVCSISSWYYWKKRVKSVLDNDSSNGTKLPALSKLLDYSSDHNLSVAKLHTYDANNGSFRFLKIYLSEKD